MLHSHQLSATVVGGDLHYEVRGTSPTAAGLSLLIDNDIIKHVQSLCSDLKLLLDSLTPGYPSC